MEDLAIKLYSSNSGLLDLNISDGCLKLHSEIWGEWSSEVDYLLDKEETDKLFNIISLYNFIAFAREKI